MKPLSVEAKLGWILVGFALAAVIQLAAAVLTFFV